MTNVIPAYDPEVVTPSDTVNLTYQADGFMAATTAGDVKVTTANGNDIVFKSVPLDTVVPIKIKRIWSTGTAATGVLALRLCRAI